MSQYGITQENFLKDVKDHSMEIIKDDGIYRHIRFSREGSSTYFFDLVTWPGHLCYTGDMGTYTFSRIRDMFEFFSTGDFYGKYPINPSYWAEKALSVDKYGKIEEFSIDIFIKMIWEYVDQRVLDTGQYQTISDAIEDSLIPSLYEERNYEGCMSLVSEFKFYFKDEKKPFEFIDFWDYNFDEFTPRYIWACYAIAWGIKKYREEKNGKDSKNSITEI